MRKFFSFLFLLFSVMFLSSEQDDPIVMNVQSVAYISQDHEVSQVNEFYFDSSLHEAEYESKDIKPPNQA